MANRKDLKNLAGLITNIKIEPGTLGVSPGRLPSFGGRRDLTLGSAGPSKLNQNSDSKPKRVYTPNLNVQRNKNKGDLNAKDDHANHKDKRDRRKDNGKGKRREKTNNLIQSSGVFAEGVAATAKRFQPRSGDSRGRDSESNFMPKPKLNLKSDYKINKEEEEMRLKELLRDDFIDDPAMEIDGANTPVILPMLSMAKVKLELKEEPKEAKPDTAIKTGEVKVKQEPLENEEVKVKIKKEKDEGEDQKFTKMETPEDKIELSDLFGKKSSGEIIFLQLPDCLPGLTPEDTLTTTRPATSSKPSTSAATTSQTQTETTPQEIPAKKWCTLNTLSEGCIGKLQFLKSGKARLVLGNCMLHVDMGTQVGFRQDLISVNLDNTTKGGDMINLGPIRTRLMCSPDWENMLAKSTA